MFRFLTPSKISLLALTFVYTESLVPASATTPLLSLIFCRLPSSSSQQDGATRFSATDLDVLTLDLLRDATSVHASAIPGRTVWDLFLNKLWSIDSLDALHSFFASLVLLFGESATAEGMTAFKDDCPQRAHLSKTSPLGVFARRAHLEFARLQFQDTISLWQSLVVYRAPSFSQWKKRHPSSSFSGLDINIDHLSGSGGALSSHYERPTGNDRIVSLEDVERLLEYQVNRIQSIGTRLPKTMIERCRNILANTDTHPNLSYYVLFLESWKVGDYHSSFDYLHRYFDYTMHNRDHVFYQYALLNLAALHADFGAYAEAIVAIRESISAAREQNDQSCLNYSLSWLYHFGKVHTAESEKLEANIVTGTDKDALNFLKVKSKETNMWSVFSTSILGEARLGLAIGDHPSSIFENLTKTSHVNLIKGSRNTVGSEIALTSTLYGRLGVTIQSWLLEQIFLKSHNSDHPTEDRLQSRCRAASLLARKGRVSEASELLAQVHHDNIRAIKPRNFWIACSGILKARKFLYCGNLNAADMVLSTLKIMKGLGQDGSLTVTLLDIESQIRRKDYSTALATLESRVAKTENSNLEITHQVKFMTLKVQILVAAGTPQKGFSIAVRAAVKSFRARIYPSLWEAIMVLSTVLISLQEFEASIRLLNSIMPHLLEGEDCDLAARSFSVLADAHVGLAGKRRSESLHYREHLSRGLESLNKAFDSFSSLEDVKGQCEMLAKKATIMHIYSEPVLANDCAAQYLAIKKAASEQF